MLDTTFEDAVEHLTDIYVFWETSADTKLLKKQTLEIMADRVIDIINNYGGNDDLLGKPEPSSEDEFGHALWLYQAAFLCKTHIEMLDEHALALVEEALWSKSMESHELVKLVKTEFLKKEDITQIIKDFIGGETVVAPIG